jgi:carbonic anhydrase/acetyltransferase-like protein (isoleucine patch superfamily)
MELHFKDKMPVIPQQSFVATGACLIGAVTLEEGASVWFNSVLRADLEPIVIGRNSNIQDGSVIHVDWGKPTVVGPNVTVGHRVILHGCTVGEGSLVGMGAVILDGAVIPPRSLVAAGSLVPQGKTYPEGSLILGSPARVARKLSEAEIAGILESAAHYREFWEAYLREGIGMLKKSSPPIGWQS